MDRMRKTRRHGRNFNYTVIGVTGCTGSIVRQVFPLSVVLAGHSATQYYPDINSYP